MRLFAGVLILAKVLIFERISVLFYRNRETLKSGENPRWHA